MEPEDLTSALSDAVGDVTPVLPEHAALAAAGRRRKRNRLLALSTAAVAVLGVSAAVALPRGGSSQNLATEPSPTTDAPTPSESPTPSPSSPSPTATPSPSHFAGGLGPDQPYASPSPTCVPKAPEVGTFTLPAVDGGKGYPPAFFISSTPNLGLDLQPTDGSKSRVLVPGVAIQARTAAGRFYVSDYQCGTSLIYTFTSGGPARLFLSFEWGFGELMLSPDEHLLAISSRGFSMVPGPATVRLVDTENAHLVRTIELPSRPQAWLADGSGFFYAASDGLHRRHFEGNEEPVITQGPVGCGTWRLVSRSYDGILLGAGNCGGGPEKITRMAEDGTPGADVTTAGRLDALFAAPGGNAALVYITSPESVYLVAPGEEQRELYSCIMPSICGGGLATVSW